MLVVTYYSFFFGFIITAELSSICYTTTEAPVIVYHAKLGALPIEEKKGRGVNCFTYHVTFLRA